MVTVWGGRVVSKEIDLDVAIRCVGRGECWRAAASMELSYRRPASLAPPLENPANPPLRQKTATGSLRAINQHAQTLHPDPAKPRPALSQAWQPTGDAILANRRDAIAPTRRDNFWLGAQSPEPGQASSIAGPWSPLPTRHKHRRAPWRNHLMLQRNMPHNLAFPAPHPSCLNHP
jgi:hypothetical protein